MSNESPTMQGTGRSNMRTSAVYLTRHGGEMHEALDVRVNRTTYSEQRARLELMPSTDMEEALRRYKEQNPDVPFDVLNCSWEDVFDQMARAKGKYEDKFKGPNNFFRWLWRKAGNASEAIDPWLQLIPDAFGLATARGCIAVLFHMAQESVKKQQKIFGAFDDITDRIASAASKRLSFHGNKEMHERSVALYTTLLDGVKELIWALDPKVDGKNVIDRYLKTQERRKTINIEAMLKRVEQKAVELDQCAERFVTKATLEARKMAGEVEAELHAVRRTAVDIKGTTTDIKMAAIETRDTVTRLGVAGNQMARGLNASMRAQSSQLDKLDHDIQVTIMDRKKLIDSVDAQNGALMMFADMLNDIMSKQELLMQQMDQERELSRRPRTSVPGAIAGVSLPALLQALQVPLSLATNDLRIVLGREHELKVRVQRQAQSLLQTKEFGRWLGGRFSDLLLVDGNMDAAAADSLSAMSLLCATLIASIGRVRPGAVVLHFFCGLHTAAGDPVAGPGGMVRTLLTQLAASLRTMRRLDLGFIRTEGQMADLQDHRLDALCDALHRVLMQVPAGTTVFCVVDGVSAFERSYRNFRADLQYVAGALKRIVANERLAALFKVLLTSSARSTDVARNIVDKWQHVTLLDASDGAGHAMITGRSFEAALLSSRQPALEGTIDGTFMSVNEQVGDDW